VMKLERVCLVRDEDDDDWLAAGRAQQRWRGGRVKGQN
jgi:hypothetical protein